LTPAPLPVIVAAASHTGRVRAHNEDAYLIDTELGLYAVADGVGGHGGGSDASALTVSDLPQRLRKSIERHTTRDLTDPELQTLLDESIEAVNARVYEAGAAMEAVGRMGTTLTGGLFLNSGNALIFNVGDSRTYCYRDETLSCITTDQSWYQSWLDAGSIGPAPPRNVILQGIGLDEKVVADWSVASCQANDLWIMCSDGLSDLLTDADILSIVKKQLAKSTPTKIDRSVLSLLCEALVDAANEAGGDDNITVIALSPIPS